jgi:DNA-binding LacI/PurR family transcriptional regulator
MADVAERAGVSVMTVSRVLNGFPGVAEATRRRVEDAVSALGYRANTAARANIEFSGGSFLFICR